MKPTRVLTLLAAMLIVVVFFNAPAISGGPYEDHPWDQEGNDPNSGENSLTPGDSLEVNAFRGELLRSTEDQWITIPLQFYNLSIIIIINDMTDVIHDKGDNPVDGKALSGQ
jgi:hypothetical protein